MSGVSGRRQLPHYQRVLDKLSREMDIMSARTTSLRRRASELAEAELAKSGRR